MASVQVPLKVELPSPNPVPDWSVDRLVEVSVSDELVLRFSVGTDTRYVAELLGQLRSSPC
jgi:hypothetical protein